MAKKNLDDLKLEANELDITYPGNISKAKLEALVAEAKGEDTTDIDTDHLTRDERLAKEASKLHRVRITCHDPQFKDHPGLTRAAGSEIFFIKRYIPFNRPTHIENVLYKVMKNAEYQWFEEKINRETGRKYKVPRSSPSFVVEDLPMLTKEEMEELAKDQAARGAIDD